MQPESDRLTSLDGIRGLAIIAVFLNHIDTSFISFPKQLNFLSALLFNSGIMGVSFLFILSGFLMAYIYPTPSNEFSFLQKRYTRIFPLFLTMSTVSFLFFIFPQIQWYIKISLIIILALFVHFVWVNVIKKLDKPIVSKLIFRLFLLLQLVVLIYYGVWIMRHPPIYLNQQLPTFVRNGTIGLVNSTLTLGFGDLIPMLDGTYWSLASEVLFYILFPLICAPFIFYLSKKTRKVKILFVLSLFPLFAGIDVLSHNILVLSLFQFQLFVYFVTGMVLAYLYKNRREVIERLSSIYLGRFNIFTVILLFLFIIAGHFIQNYLPKALNSWFDIGLSIPFTYILAISLNKKTYLYKFLSSKALAFLGLISYSIYLSHTPILHIVEANIHVSNYASNLFVIVIIFAVTLVISYFLYRMLEKPYFLKSAKDRAKINNQNYRVSNLRIYFLILSIIFIYAVATFGAFQSDFNFFSIEHHLPSSDLIYPKKNDVISLADSKVNMRFKSEDDNLGLVVMHITRHGGPPPSPQKDYEMTFKIKDLSSDKWYETITYNMSWIGDSPNHVFGFSPIQNSKGKTYLIELSQPKETFEYISVDRSNINIRAIYSVNKKELVKKPTKFIAFLGNRILNVILDREAQYVLLMFLPFLMISGLIFFEEKYKKI